MLNENIKNLREQNGFSQEELAAKLCVVRQTVSKWEKGLSVPDADMLIKLADALGTKASVLLGEETSAEYDKQAAIAAKLEVMNRELLRREQRRKKIWHIVFIVLAVLSVSLLVYAAVVAGSVQFAASFPHHAGSDVSIIGGADGPTSIIVTRRPAPDIFRLVLTAIIAAVSVVGIIKTRAK